MKVYPKQSPGCLAVGASAGAVDPQIHRKWVWAFIDAVANLVNVVVSNHSARTTQIVVFFDDENLWFIWQCRCWQALGNVKEMRFKKSPFFVHTCPHPPPPLPPPPANTDLL